METHVEYDRVITETTGTVEEVANTNHLDPTHNLVSAFRKEQWQRRHRNLAYQATFS